MRREDLHPLSPKEGVERFLRFRESSVRESTMQNARTRLRHFLDWCEMEDVENLNDLTGRDFADFVNWRKKDIAPITMQKQLSSVRQACRYWADIEAVPEGLAEKIHAPELPDGAESRDGFLEPDRAEGLLAYHSRFHYASKEHAALALLWRTGMRRSALRGLDECDLRPNEHAVALKHRPETGTALKNGNSGERWVYLGPKWYQIIEDYRDNPDRHDVKDEHGRKPLFTSRYGRPSGDTIYGWINRATHPCNYRECPHDRDPDTCEAKGRAHQASKCPSARSPHEIRRGAITAHLNEDTPPETVSERMDVSLEVLYKHYDARTEQEKMDVRRNQLP
ncbi:tyrosine-type recombinase/integrase [Haloarchaeobius sp. DYHT-AS-18]|uniref:tyrosine-type recombinase/integrase n=1 Tax=Haloarchaeobius sp. DYHT-AS-18 TaxID=3446117 RepID=UPI003EB9E626